VSGAPAGAPAGAPPPPGAAALRDRNAETEDYAATIVRHGVLDKRMGSHTSLVAGAGGGGGGARWAARYVALLSRGFSRI